MSIAKFTPKIWYLPLVVAKKVTAAKGIFSFHVFSKLCIFVICTTAKIRLPWKLLLLALNINPFQQRLCLIYVCFYIGLWRRLFNYYLLNVVLQDLVELNGDFFRVHLTWKAHLRACLKVTWTIELFASKLKSAMKIWPKHLLRHANNKNVSIHAGF